MSGRGGCCEICDRNPTCGVDCGSCETDETPDEIRAAMDAFDAAYEAERRAATEARS